MPEANYQENYFNPYMQKAPEPERDKGLWSVLARAIRSTVPERPNQSFDPNIPVGGTNVPYVKPGFGRALLGDRGGDYNRAATLGGLDRGVSRRLADRQAQYHQGVLGQEQSNALGQIGEHGNQARQTLAQSGQQALQEIGANNEGALTRLVAGSDLGLYNDEAKFGNELQLADKNNLAAQKRAETIAQGGITRASLPDRGETPEATRLKDAQTRLAQAKAQQEEIRANFMKTLKIPGQQNSVIQPQQSGRIQLSPEDRAKLGGTPQQAQPSYNPQDLNDQYEKIRQEMELMGLDINGQPLPR